ncbi:MAG: nucleoside-diphosphate-sugar epimerase [Pseudohongiellaceae bacterium]|jgi:nucleoside-diphosphate-sugar epimerase
MKALVTGGGGFLGGAIVAQLLQRGDQVWSFARGRYPQLAEQGVEVLRGDLANEKDVHDALGVAANAGCETVFHVAALAGSWGPESSYYGVNVAGTDNVIAACRAHGIERLVYTSSPSVVLSGSDVVGGDESLPYADHWLAHYPATKAEGERRVLAANGSGLSTVALRPHLIWGPGDGHLLPRLVDRSRKGRLRRIGKGDKLIDAVYIDDAARAHLLADERLVSERRSGEVSLHDGAQGADVSATSERGGVQGAAGGSALGAAQPVAGRPFFVTAGAPIETWTMVNHLLAAAGEAPLTKQISAKAARAAGAVLETVWRALYLKSEPPMTRWAAEELSTSHCFDITAARRDLGYEPQVSLEDGLARLRAWCASDGI